MRANEHTRYAMLKKGAPRKQLYVALDVWVMVRQYALDNGLTIQEATQDLIGMGLATANGITVTGKAQIT